MVSMMAVRMVNRKVAVLAKWLVGQLVCCSVGLKADLTGDQMVVMWKLLKVDRWVELMVDKLAR